MFTWKITLETRNDCFRFSSSVTRLSSLLYVNYSLFANSQINSSKLKSITIDHTCNDITTVRTIQINAELRQEVTLNHIFYGGNTNVVKQVCLQWVFIIMILAEKSACSSCFLLENDFNWFCSI